MTLADVRAFPRSRRYPPFKRDELERALRSAGNRYVPIPRLAERRRRLGPMSPNTARRNPGLTRSTAAEKAVP